MWQGRRQKSEGRSQLAKWKGEMAKSGLGIFHFPLSPSPTAEVERRDLEQHCSEEILSAYLDGDLESEASGTTAEHLAECEVCRHSLAQVRAIRDAAPGMEQLVPPERVWGAIQERIHGSRSRRRQLTRLFWVGVPALAAALLHRGSMTTSFMPRARASAIFWVMGMAACPTPKPI